MDLLLKGMIRDGGVRVFIVNARKAVDEITSRHQTTPVVSAAMARLVAATLILASMQKQGKITAKIAGNGPIGMLVADANSDLEVRAFAENRQVDLPLNDQNKLDVGRAVGNVGYLQVIKDVGLKQQFNSQVELQSGELGIDFSYYFKESEQIPSLVALSGLIDVDYSIKVAGGIVIQLLPGATEEDLLYVESFAPQLSALSNLMDTTPKVEKLALQLFPDIQHIETYPVRFKCSCRKERLLTSLAALSLHDLKELEAQKEKIEITCEFCNTHFYFDQQDIQQAIAIKYANQQRNEEAL